MSAGIKNNQVFTWLLKACKDLIGISAECAFTLT